MSVESAPSEQRPAVAVKITRYEKLSVRGLAQYQGMVAEKIRAAGIPLGLMLDLAEANDMTSKELDMVWIKEFASHNVHSVYVTETPEGDTEIVIWTNDQGYRSQPGEGLQPK